MHIHKVNENEPKNGPKIISKLTKMRPKGVQMDLKMGSGVFWSVNMARRGFQKTKTASKKFLGGPARRPSEPKGDENGTGAPFFGVSGGPQMDQN